MHKNLVSGLLVDSLINGLANWSNFRRKKMIVTFAFMLASFMNDDYVVAS